MAAVITTPPILLQNSAQDGSAPFSGPFEVGSALYLVTVEFSPVNAVHVWKSTDGGNTYAIQDAANQPVGISAYDVKLIGTVFSIVTAPFITPKISLTTFDTATDTYGATVASGYVIAGSPLIANLSDGTVYIFYQQGTALKYTTFAAGAFGPEVAFAAAGNQAFRAVSVDSSDVIYAYWRIFAGGLTTLNLSTITAGVLSAPQAIHADASSIFVGLARQNSAVWGTKLAFASCDSNTRAGVWIGDPIGAPVWAFTLIDDIDWAGMGLAGEVDDEPFVFVSAGTLYVFWIALDYDPILAADVIDRIYYKSNDGSGWSAPVLFYDAVTNPGSGTDAFSQFIHVTNFTKLSNGAFGSLINLEQSVFCSSFILLDVVCDITLTVRPGSSGVPVVVPDNGEVYALPPAIAGQQYPIQILRATEANPAENFEYSVTSGAPPPKIFIGGPVPNTPDATNPNPPAPTPNNPTPVTNSTVGVPVYGTPQITQPDPSVPVGPVMYTWHSKVRLIA